MNTLHEYTADYRAIFEECKTEDENITYFVTFGTHEELYGEKRNKLGRMLN